MKKAPFILIGILVVLAVFSSWFFSVEKSPPRIVVLTEPIYMVGVSSTTTVKTVFKDVAAQRKAYASLRSKTVIPNARTPRVFVAVTKNYHDESWEYLIGDVVTKPGPAPENMQAFAIPARTYAVFTVRPRNLLLWGYTIGKIKNYAYSDWLPESKYEADTSVLTDFEYQ
ncbi:MAG: GyrI-like domain-containing protein, partial [Spirochaetia bacterium]|nr:GyrI-like domain-containing protein [Spirochaetia bacterium]